MVLSMPRLVQIGIAFRERGVPQWPPYLPSVLSSEIPKLLKPEAQDEQVEKIVVSDQPWAVAWYADRLSLWLPNTKRGFEQLEDRASSLGTPFAGILVSPSSSGDAPAPVVRAQYGEFSSLIFNGLVIDITAPGVGRTGFPIFDKDPKLAEIYRRYPYLTALERTDLLFYGERAAKPATESR